MKLDSHGHVGAHADVKLGGGNGCVFPPVKRSTGMTVLMCPDSPRSRSCCWDGPAANRMVRFGPK